MDAIIITSYWTSVGDSLLTWWRHKMETFSALLVICAGNSPVSGEFPAQRPMTRSFVIIFDVRLNKQLSNVHKVGDLRRYRVHYDVSVMTKWPLSTHSNNGNEYSRQYEWYAMTRLVEWTIYRPLSHLADNNWLESSDAFMSQCSGSLSIRQWCNLIHIVNWNCCIKLQGNFNWNSNIFIQEKYNWKCRLHNVGRFGPTSLLLIMQGVLSSRAMHTLDVTFSDIETATSCWGASRRISISVSFFG